MIQWICDNKDWLFSGLGLFIVSTAFAIFKWRKSPMDKPQVTNNVNVNIANHLGNDSADKQSSTENSTTTDLTRIKEKTHIMFVDDDGRFKVVSIIQKSGWIHTRRVADISSLDSLDITSNHIFFVDIQGVGKRLNFREEGLGLAEAIKDKYPEKKVVIYSVQDDGKRFHKALRKADDFLSKNADPYEFQELTERLAREYWEAT